MSDWKHKVVLSDGESLNFVGSSMKGFMQETDVMAYDVIGSNGAKAGTVIVEDHTAVKGFRRTIRVVQKNIEGKVVVEDAWTV